jgi:hypothetical protein
MISQVFRESDGNFPFPLDDEDLLDEELEAMASNCGGLNVGGDLVGNAYPSNTGEDD